MTTGRLPMGGAAIDRARSIAFTFDDVQYTGFAGDTLASALLANGIAVVARSIYHDRPRGVMTAGPEEPNALVQVVWPSGISEPMVNAATAPLVAGMRVRSLTGQGRLETPDDGARFDAVYAHVEVLVIGAGAAGRSACAEARAADPDARVLVLDRDPAASGDGIQGNTTAIGVYDHDYVIAVQRHPVAGTEGRLWRIVVRGVLLGLECIRYQQYSRWVWVRRSRQCLNGHHHRSGLAGFRAGPLAEPVGRAAAGCAPRRSGRLDLPNA